MQLIEIEARLVFALVWLSLIWTIEGYVSTQSTGRVRHGLANLVLAAVNGILLTFTVGLLSVSACELAKGNLLYQAWPRYFHAGFAFLGLDLFGYLWHRANHRSPTLWRFHAVHHSDDAMDVTTSGRFHFVELGVGAILRLPILYALGVATNLLLMYELVLVAVSMLHHSRIKLGRWDTALQWIIVTPAMHSIHHSRNGLQQNRNFSSVLSIWDRLFGTHEHTMDLVTHGLEDFEAPERTHSVRAMLVNPFCSRHRMPPINEPTLKDTSSR